MVKNIETFNQRFAEDRNRHEPNQKEVDFLTGVGQIDEFSTYVYQNIIFALNLLESNFEAFKTLIIKYNKKPMQKHYKDLKTKGKSIT